MKTLTRILIISSTFTLLAVLMLVAVNAGGANSPIFGGGRFDEPEVRPFNGGDGGAQFRPDGERGDRNEGGVITRWIFGLVKDVGVIAILVISIVWPKSIARKKRKEAAVKATLQGSKQT